MTNLNWHIRQSRVVDDKASGNILVTFLAPSAAPIEISN